MKGLLFKLNNGIEMPAFGLGVYQSTPAEAAEALKTALEDGYRLIDTAAAYMNEEQVGGGIRRSGINRSQVFVITKLWMSDYGYDQALHAFNRSRRIGPFAGDSPAPSRSAPRLVQPRQDSGEHRGILRSLPGNSGISQRSGVWPEARDRGARGTL